MKLDQWQQDVLDTKGNVCLRSGRQVGKSTIISIKAAEYAVKNSKKTVLIIASVERQALLMFEKTYAYLFDNYKHKIVLKGKEKPTKSRVKLQNGSMIYSLPTGLSGYGIRGYTVDLLIADEAAFIPEEVWTAVTPMLAVTKGAKILLSTPFGKGGYFYECFADSNFTSFHVSSEDCPRIPQDFLDKEKERMTLLQYTQEYLGEFVDEIMQFFPDELIKSCMVSDLPPVLNVGDNFLGVDVARMGEDETVLFSLHRNHRRKLIQLDMEISRKTYLTETIRRIKDADNKYKYKSIYIDDGGMGVGVFDPLLEDSQTKRKVVAVNNASRSLEHSDTPRKKRLLKEDLYNNLKVLMEDGKIQLNQDDKTFRSLKSIQAEYKESGKLIIHGRYTHITEALIRAAWCMKDKRLNIFFHRN